MTEFRLIRDGWNAEILEARRAYPGRIRIICPFIKAPTLKRILAAANSTEVEVITRFDLACFDEGVSDIDALALVLNAGGKVRGVRGLHSKLFLFGDEVAIATSANVTEAAFHRNHEFGFVATDPDVVTSCETYFADLWKAAKPNLKSSDLKAWRKKLDDRRKKGDASKKGPRLPDYGAKVDQSSPFAPSGPAAEQENQGFIKFFGNADNRAPRNRQINELIAENGATWACTYPKSKPPRQVQDGDVIYMARLVENPNDILIFGKAIGRAHRDKVDVASAKEIKLRNWKAKWPNYVRVHDGRFIDASLDDGIAMTAMLDSLGSDAFASTQEHAKLGNGNTDPTLSYNRKAHMLLTDQSRAWIEVRLEAALRRHGEVDVTKLRFQPPGLPIKADH